MRPPRPAYPRVSPCRHCGLVVLRDLDAAWIHASLSYVCRDRSGWPAATVAEPEPPEPHGPPSGSHTRTHTGRP